MLEWLIRFWKEMKGNTGESDSTGGSERGIWSLLIF
jgi:hypothetical protein